MKKGKMIIISAAAVIAVGAGAVLLRGGGKKEKTCDSLIAQRLVKQDITDSINISGSISGEEVAIGNSQSSVCVDVMVNNGDMVKEGDVLFIFDDTTLKSEYNRLLEQYNAERKKSEHDHSENEKLLEKAKDAKDAALAQAAADIEYADKLYNDALAKKDRLSGELDDAYSQRDELNDFIAEVTARLEEEGEDTEDSFELNILSKDYGSVLNRIASLESEISVLENSIPELERQAENARTMYDNTKVQQENNVSSVESSLGYEAFQMYSITQADLERMKERVDGCVVKAPVSGIVSDIMVCKGASAMGTELAKIINTSDYHVRASVSENKIVKLKTGAEVTIKTLATGDEELKGVIKSISNYGTAGMNGVSYPIDIDVLDDKKAEGVLLNMTANIRIVQGVVPDAFAVPYDAIVNEKGRDHILTAEEKDGHYKLRRIYVERGSDTNYLCQISSFELEDGMPIVLMPSGHDEGDIVDLDYES